MKRYRAVVNVLERGRTPSQYWVAVTVSVEATWEEALAAARAVYEASPRTACYPRVFTEDL